VLSCDRIRGALDLIESVEKIANVREIVQATVDEAHHFR